MTNPLYFRDYLTNNLESRNNSWNQNLATSDKLYEGFNGLNKRPLGRNQKAIYLLNYKMVMGNKYR